MTHGTAPGTQRQWRGVLLAVIGLLAGMALIGVVGLAINRGITDLVTNALRYDLELEDNADDLRVAVLDVRHYHRDLLFNDPSPARVREWEERYAAMLGEIDELAQLGVIDADAPQPGELRAVAEEYHASFQPAIELFRTNPALFDAASLEGLERLAELDAASAELDALGEELADQVLRDVQDAAGSAALVMLTVLAGLVVVGAVLGLAVLRLVEESRRVAEREHAAALAMGRVSQAKTDFIADVSHELRTPLTVLRGNAEVGLAVNDDPEHGEVLREIVGEAERMAAMVEDLLFLARSDTASRPPLELAEVDASDLLDEIVARAKTLAAERGSELSADVRASGRLEVDARRVGQAVLVAVDNAAKYAPGAPIRLSARTEDVRLLIEVSDRGPGIPPEQLPNVFERFNRGGRRSDGRGAGLGLSIARRIVEGHGGSIDAASRVGEGTTIAIRLPLALRSEAGGRGS